MPNLTVDRALRQPEGTPFVATLTPKMAEYLLEHNKENYRALNKNRVSKYGNDMTAGKWKMNYADNVVLTANGDGVLVLLNGQHRCGAVVKSGVPIETFVVRVSPEAADASYMDLGATRTVAQILRYGGVDYAPIKSAIVHQLLRQQGVPRGVITLDMIRAALKQYHDGIAVATLLPSRTGTTAGLRAAVARAVYTCDTPRVLEFVEQFSFGWSGKPEDIMVDKFVRHIAFRVGKKIKANDEFTLICERVVHAFCSRNNTTSAQDLRPAPTLGALLPVDPFAFPGFSFVPQVEKKELIRRKRISKAYARPGTLGDKICKILKHFNKPITANQMWNNVKKDPEFENTKKNTLFTALRNMSKRNNAIISRRKNPKGEYVYIYTGE